VDEYGLVALIFAREVSDPLISLVKTIDRQLEGAPNFRGSNEKPGVHVVFCSDDPGLKQQLDRLIAREGIRNVVLSIGKDRSNGPRRYKVAREAELTVMIFKDQDNVIANHVLDSLDLTAEKGAEIVKTLKQVLPK
jgi:hypothetical protein